MFKKASCGESFAKNISFRLLHCKSYSSDFYQCSSRILILLIDHLLIDIRANLDFQNLASLEEE